MTLPDGHKFTPAEIRDLSALRARVGESPRAIRADEHLPLVADSEHGVLVPSCDERGPVHVIPARDGVALRVGGEARLCFTCGPDGGVYHPTHNVPDDGADYDPDAGTWQYTVADLLAVLERLA